MKFIYTEIRNLEFNRRVGGILSRTFAPSYPMPMMKLKSNRQEVVFVHIPKTAGTSIANYFFQHPLKGHIPISRLFHQDINRYNTSFKFTFTRNPLSRFESGFYHYKRAIHEKLKMDRSHKISELFKGIDSIDSFVSKIYSNSHYKKAVFKLPIFRPQCEWITVPGERNQGKIIGVDFIGKYENLNQNITSLKKILGITVNAEFPVLRKNDCIQNKHVRNVDSYLRLIRSYYRKDLALLDYSIWEINKSKLKRTAKDWSYLCCFGKHWIQPINMQK